MLRRRLWVVCFLSWWFTHLACAIGPSYKTDAELVEFPLIVIGQWDRAEFRERGEEEDFPRRLETELRVHRVVMGRLSLGKHRVTLGRAIAWKNDGTGLATWTSTHIGGDVEVVTKPNLWFLDRHLSFEGGRRKFAWVVLVVSSVAFALAAGFGFLAVRARRSRHAAFSLAVLLVASLIGYRESAKVWALELAYYRAIQPEVLEPYFVALDSGDPTPLMEQLLSSKDPLVVSRSLHFLCGWMWPWPYELSHDSLHYLTPAERGKVHDTFAETVKGRILEAPEEVRPLAVSVYAEFAGAECVEYVETLLDDRNERVRGIALGTLARHRREASIPRIEKAIATLKEPYLTLRVIEELTSWGDGRLVPALVTFLEHGTVEYSSSGVPAVRARNGLREITGHWFPFDRAASGRAWAQVGPLPKRDRKAALEGLLPGEEFPLKAEFVREVRPVADADIPPEDDEDEHLLVSVRVTNASSSPIALERYPDVELEWPEGSGFGWSKRRGSGAELSLRLESGASLEIEVVVIGDFLLADPKDRTMQLEYAWEGERQPPPFWFGRLPVQPGPSNKGVGLRRSAESPGRDEG
ncbi:MAG: HEAT repeat domain-containing protein [Planctomycetota bacterium]